MDTAQIVSEARSRLTDATKHFDNEIKKIRTGRAHPAMLDGINVEAYGQSMPLKAVAGITAPEAQLLQVTPFDPANLQPISDAIRTTGADLNPADDGRVVRIKIPPLTEETRKAMVKILHQKMEEAFIAHRQTRHEAFRKAEQAEKDKQLGKDERIRLEKQIDDLLASQKSEVEQLSKAKEQEIMTV